MVSRFAPSIKRLFGNIGDEVLREAYLKAEAIGGVKAVALPVGGALHLPGSACLVTVHVKHSVSQAAGRSHHWHAPISHRYQLQSTRRDDKNPSGSALLCAESQAEEPFISQAAGALSRSMSSTVSRRPPTVLTTGTLPYLINISCRADAGVTISALDHLCISGIVFSQRGCLSPRRPMPRHSPCQYCVWKTSSTSHLWRASKSHCEQLQRR